MGRILVEYKEQASINAKMQRFRVYPPQIPLAMRYACSLATWETADESERVRAMLIMSCEVMGLFVGSSSIPAVGKKELTPDYDGIAGEMMLAPLVRAL